MNRAWTNKEDKNNEHIQNSNRFVNGRKSANDEIKG